MIRGCLAKRQRPLPFMRMLPENAGVLRILVEADRPLTAFEIGRADGRYRMDDRRAVASLGRYLVHHLLTYGVVARTQRAPERYDITERGRIALAIYRAKESRRDHRND